jgi:gliding motility-associated-like protein
MELIEKTFKTVKFLLYLGLINNSLLAQTNFVPNASFENFNSCPRANSSIETSITVFPTVSNWLRPSIGTPDYFNACNLTINTTGVPANEAGYQQPHQGNAYVGLIAYYNQNSSFDGLREYIQVQLTAPLVANKDYEITYYLSPTGAKSVSNISAYVSSNKLQDFLSKVSLNCNPQVNNNEPLLDSSIWYKVSGSFKALGGEQWLTIGNFLKDNECTPFNLGTQKPETNLIGQAYIFIDDISIIEKQSKTTKYLCNSFDSVLIEVKSFINKFIWNDGDSTKRRRYFNKETTIWIKNFLADGSSFNDSFLIAKTPYIFNKIMSDTSICNKSELRLTLPFGSPKYLWSNGGTDSFTVIKGTGQYWLNAQENGCVRIDSFNILEKAKPTILNYADTFICKGSSIQIGNPFNNDNYIYQWNGTINSKTLLVKANSINYLSVKDSFCYNYDTVTIFEKELPKIEIIGPSFLCAESFDTITLKANSFTKNIWYPNAVESNFINIKTAGKYWHSVSDKWGCINTDTIFVKDACKPIFYMPNAFTPNNDGVNDYLNFKGKYIDFFSIEIYNRWGQLVYQNNDFTNNWDGTNNGIPLPEDVYVYHINYASQAFDFMNTQTGTLTIIR